jgi:hypothetical protein
MNKSFFRLVACVLLLTLLSPPSQARGQADTTTGEAKQVKTVRLLNVGNSFSGNATRYLSNIVAAAGHKLVHQQASIGGGSMAQHWGRAQTNETDATAPLGLYGSKRSLKQYLTAEKWDVVTIQQASIRSHDVETYRPYAKQLQGYIKQHAPGAELVIHQTWAYREDDPRFDRSAPKSGEPITREQMYRQLTNAYATIAAELGVRLIPVGDAFHFADIDPKWGFKPGPKFDAKQAKSPELPDQKNSLHVGWKWSDGKNGKSAATMDGHHANMAGQYLGACVFYEFLYRESIVGNKFVPPGLEKDYAAFLQQTAHRAMAQASVKGGRADAGGGAEKSAKAAKAAPKPALVAAIPSVKPEAVADQSFDLVVIGGTPGGIACAVRGAREGLKVLLVERTKHLGGMLLNGLCQWDALYDGLRAPIFAEYVRSMNGFYRSTYGENSPQYQYAQFTQKHYPLSRFEPSVVERLFNKLVLAEQGITVLTGYFPVDVQRQDKELRRVILKPWHGENLVGVNGRVFVDASYEADLAALAKVPYRVGREARGEFNEPHAGKIFTNIEAKPSPQDAVEGRLNIRPYGQRQGKNDPSSPFTADRAVQAYNYRFCITNDPKNRRLPEKPANYNRDEFLHYERKSMGGEGPNGKTTFNSPILAGENHTYPEGDWAEREKVTKRHLDFALGLMYFLQNDESLSAAQRAKFRQWGLPLDEYTDNGNLPYEMYVRETRRIVGRYVYNENDGSIAPGLARTPVHGDSIAITDWYMDSHSCTMESRPGYKYEGKLILTEQSRPGQVPYRSILPRGVDNLLVPVCLSATHVAWGSVRLEPVWMQVGEAAGLAAALAVKHKTTPAKLNPDLLLRALVERRFMVSFFNDLNVTGSEKWIPAVQYLGAKGFFHDYNARIGDGLKYETGKAWAEGLAQLREGKIDPAALALAVAKAENANGREMKEVEFAALLPSSPKTQALKSQAIITREEAVRLMWELL